jgi:hypothetical protein
VPRRGSPYDWRYQRERERLLASGPRCWWPGCDELATEADHDPPVKLHKHKGTGAGCCRLQPSCSRHQRVQGGMIRARLTLPADFDLEADFVEVDEPLAGFASDDPVWDVAWLDELREVPLNAVWPRFMTVPHPEAVGSYGPQFVGWSSSVFGVELRWFQRLVAFRLLEHDAGGRLVWGVLILSLARQLGKSTLLASLLLWRLVHGREMFGEPQTLIHCARDAAAAREVQRPARTWALPRQDEYKVIVANGKEMVEHLPSGSRWAVMAEGAVFGWSATTALVDECWDIDVSTVKDGISRTLVAHRRQSSQLLLTSTARGGEDATPLFPNYRATNIHALAVPSRDLFIEWSAPRDAVLTDPAVWRLASPWWDEERERSVAEAVEEAQKVGDPDAIEAIRTQDLNIWPASIVVRGRGDALFDDEVWQRAFDDVETVGPFVLAVEDWAGVGASAVAAGVAEDGRIVLGGWCHPSREAAYLWVRHWASVREGSVLLVGSTLAADVALADMPAQVERRTGADTRSGLSLLRELVKAGRVVHDGSSDMREQMLAARVTPAAGGGLALVNLGRLDLVRAAAWAAAEAERGALASAQVFGGSL